MSAGFDPTGDLVAVADGLEAVTFKRRGSHVGIPIAQALRQKVGKGEAEPTGGHYTAADTAWQLPITAPRPAPGDRLIDGAGQCWTLLEVQRAAGGTRWRCIARNLQVAHGLNDTIRIQRARWSKGRAGAPTPQWVDEYVGILARIQPAEVARAETSGVQGLNSTHKVFLSEAIEAVDGLRIIDEAGRIYDVLSYEQAARIDALLTIFVHQSQLTI